MAVVAITGLLVAAQAATASGSSNGKKVDRAGTLKANCAKAGLLPPTIQFATLEYPGSRRGHLQTVAFSVEVASMPEECWGSYRRRVSIVTQIQDPMHSARWYDTGTCRVTPKECVGMELDQRRRRHRRPCVAADRPRGEVSLLRLLAWQASDRRADASQTLSDESQERQGGRPETCSASNGSSGSTVLNGVTRRHGRTPRSLKLRPTICLRSSIDQSGTGLLMTLLTDLAVAMNH